MHSPPQASPPGGQPHATPLRLACVGHAAIDHVFGIEAFAPHPTKTPASSYCLRGGGMAFNAALAAARLGASVRLIGRVGDDLGADFLRERLRAEGVEQRGLQSVAGASTSVAAVVVDAQGQRQVFNHRGTALVRAHALDLRQLQGADAVLVDPRWVAGAEAALRWARRHGVLSVLDADVPHSRTCSAWCHWSTGRCFLNPAWPVMHPAWARMRPCAARYTTAARWPW